MRYLIDTHIYIWYVKERDRLSSNVLALLEDYENDVCVSSETLKELIVLWNNKPHFHQWWETALDLVRSVEDICGFRVLYMHKEHYETYANLEINEKENHHDPSDHLIISHALTNRIPLISGDHKFRFYRNQGLDLIENN